MAYKPEVVIDALRRMKESEYRLNMHHWCVTPEGKAVSAIRAVTKQVDSSHVYVPAPPGTTFCFAGFLAMFEVERLSKASKDGMFNVGTAFTENLAANSIGLGYNLEYSDSNHYRSQRAIEQQFEALFYRKKITTVNGLQRILKKEGLLQLV